MDWFHLTMKLTVLGQYGKGLVQCETELGEAICDQIERLKWSLWQVVYLQHAANSAT